VVGIAAFFIFRKKDSFELTTDPLRMSYDYGRMLPKDKYPKPTRYGLNTENDNNADICTFNKKFNSKTKFLENENMDPCALTARQYCSVLYSQHQELFTNMYSGLGECEKVESENCRECPALDIEKEENIYYTQINRGV
jgi:hypothetical protein